MSVLQPPRNVVRLQPDAENPVTLKGSNGEQDLRGLHADRPAAAAGNSGWTYWSVNEPSAPGTVYVSDGSAWAVLSVL
jgi:hypothetical protein